MEGGRCCGRRLGVGRRVAFGRSVAEDCRKDGVLEVGTFRTKRESWHIEGCIKQGVLWSEAVYDKLVSRGMRPSDELRIPEGAFGVGV